MRLWSLMGGPHVALGQQPLVPTQGGAWPPLGAEDAVAECASSWNP